MELLKVLDNNEDIHINRDIFSSTIDLFFIVIYMISQYNKVRHNRYDYKTGLFYRYEIVYHQLVNLTIISNKFNLSHNWLPRNVKLDDWINNVHEYGNDYYPLIKVYLNLTLHRLSHHGVKGFRNILGVLLDFSKDIIDDKNVVVNEEDYLKYKASDIVRKSPDNIVTNYIANVLDSEFGFPKELCRSYFIKSVTIANASINISDTKLID